MRLHIRCTSLQVYNLAETITFIIIRKKLNALMQGLPFSYVLAYTVAMVSSRFAFLCVVLQIFRSSRVHDHTILKFNHNCCHLRDSLFKMVF